MGIKIALFQGASNNAGDYLIVHRTKELLKKYYPECQITEFYRNQSLESYKEEINSHDIGIFAGGPLYFSEFYPVLSPFVSNIREIKIPLMIIGAGWFNVSGEPDVLYQDTFKYPQKKLLTRVVNDTKILGCRDYYSAHVLRNNGFNNVLMTGCPAWYDLNNVDNTKYSGPTLDNIKTICISDCGNVVNMEQVARVLYFARGFFGDKVKIKFVTHKTMNEHIKTVLMEDLEELNIEFVDISGGLKGFEVYDDCDLHIGFRVHAHIYNLSIRNASILIEEDNRGKGVNDALGLMHISSDYQQPDQGLLKRKSNEYIQLQLKDYLLDMESCGFKQMEFAYEKMKHYYENMEKHIKSIEAIINK